MREAIIQSCNIYFLSPRQRHGHRPHLEVAHLLGFGTDRLDLPHEEAGTVPDPEWKKRAVPRDSGLAPGGDHLGVDRAGGHRGDADPDARFAAAIGTAARCTARTCCCRARSGGVEEERGRTTSKDAWRCAAHHRGDQGRDVGRGQRGRTGGRAKIGAATSAPRRARPRCQGRRATSTRTSCRRRSGTTLVRRVRAQGRSQIAWRVRAERRTRRDDGGADRPRRAGAFFQKLDARQGGQQLASVAVLSNFDWILFLAILAACSIGARGDLFRDRREHRAPGVPPPVDLAAPGDRPDASGGLIDYHTLAESHYAFYGLSLALLLLTLSTAAWSLQQVVARDRRVQFQPSEIAKSFHHSDAGGLPGRERVRGLGVLHFAAICAIIGLPVLLILRQPDLGTACSPSRRFYGRRRVHRRDPRGARS